ncbi:MAG TPA: CAP domain-containing protein, partial [Clostridia bacterium]|nr:CAP domain-containing protein [Clostridia bacterium]
GIRFSAAGENIAMGQPTPQAVMTAWMNSPGHRSNILSATYNQIGVGVAKNSRGQLYWTQMFIKSM